MLCTRHRLALALSLVSAGSAHAVTRCVNLGGTGGCFSSVQAAINASSNGDVIDVAAGTYLEDLTLSKQLTLRGALAGVTACGRVGEPESVLA